MMIPMIYLTSLNRRQLLLETSISTMLSHLEIQCFDQEKLLSPDLHKYCVYILPDVVMAC